MNNAKHTPGPWVAALGERLNTDVYHIDKQGNRVFVAEFATQTDAVLSAAAPAMYEALHGIVLAHETGMKGSAMALRVKIARDALAQAEGRQA